MSNKGKNYRTEKEGHFRATMKSNHLAVADLEDMIDNNKPLVFTISHVQNEYDVIVAGKKTDALIAYFKEDIKPWVINAGNAKNIRRFVPNNSHLVQHWKNILIELYVDNNVTFGNEKTGGIRVKLQQPKPLDAPIIDNRQPITDERLGGAIKSINDGDFTIEKLKERFILTEFQFSKLEPVEDVDFEEAIKSLNEGTLDKEYLLKEFVLTESQLQKLGEI